MIINGLFVSGAVVLAALAFWGVWLLLRHDDRSDPFASYGLTVNAADAETLGFGPMPPEIAHDHADPYGPEGAGIRHRYAPPGDPGPAPYETSPAPFPPATPPGEQVPGDEAAAPGITPDPAPLHHDEHAPVQRFHDGPPDPAAAVEHIAPQALPPPPAGPLAKALAAVRDMPVDGYLGHVEQATAYEDREPFRSHLSDETIARGIPAIKDQVA